MLKWLFGKRKQKPRFFLGKVVVLKRTDIKRYFEQVGLFNYECVEEWIPVSVRSALELPDIVTRTKSDHKDYGLDVVVAKYQFGGGVGIDLSEVFIPLIWRPKIYIALRAFDPESGKTVFGVEREQKMPWKQFFKRVFSLRAAVGLKSLFDRHDLEPMLLVGLINIFEEVKAKKLL